jgi:protein-S-isoprenylcysteine O-methyltransferase Ste14
MLFLKVIVFTLVAPGTVTALVPYLLLSHSDTRPLPFRQFRYFGPFPPVVGVCMYLRCLWDFAVRGRGTPAPIDPPRHLVVNGLYCYLRNPMYVGLLLVLLGEAVFFQARVLFAYAAVLLGVT